MERPRDREDTKTTIMAIVMTVHVETVTATKTIPEKTVVAMVTTGGSGTVVTVQTRVVTATTGTVRVAGPRPAGPPLSNVVVKPLPTSDRPNPGDHLHAMPTALRESWRGRKTASSENKVVTSAGQGHAVHETGKNGGLAAESVKSPSLPVEITETRDHAAGTARNASHAARNGTVIVTNTATKTNTATLTGEKASHTNIKTVTESDDTGVSCRLTSTMWTTWIDRSSSNNTGLNYWFSTVCLLTVILF